MTAPPIRRARLAPGRSLGLALVAAMLLLAVLGPMLVTVGPDAQDLSDILSPPSATYWLGTDHLGRSVLSRLVHAARLSLLLGSLSVLAAATAGIGLGLLAAWRGGAADTLLTALADAVLALPGLLLVVLLAAFAEGELWPLFLGLSLAMWVEWFRMTRATAAACIGSKPVEAARLLGFGPAHILRRHVLPPLAPLFGTLAAFGLAQAVLAIGALGFIGVGLRPPTAEWGLMMTESLPHYADLPLAMIAPAVCLTLLVLGLQLLAGRRA
jgi:peptide/nickel transport system permease protein